MHLISSAISHTTYDDVLYVLRAHVESFSISIAAHIRRQEQNCSRSAVFGTTECSVMKQMNKNEESKKMK